MKENKTMDKQKKISDLLIDILDNGVSDHKIAKLYYKACSEKFLWDEINEKWYFINKYNIWKIDKQGNKVRYDMCKTLNKLLLDKYSELSLKLKGSLKENLIENYSKAVKYLEKNKSKKEALDELIGLCKTEKIYEKMDNVNLYLFAFENGVYDLSNNIFRLPKPKELISCTCNYNFEEKNKNIEDAMESIDKIIGSMFLIQEDKDVILMEIAKFLNGVPALEEFYIWIGKARNGKRVLSDLIKHTFGSYYDPIDVEYFNQTKDGKSANAADEIMEKKKNCRIFMSTESETDI